MRDRILQVGDRICVGGGYAANIVPEWMAAAGGDRYYGTVIEFISGQNEQLAPVVELDEEIVLPAAGRGGPRTRAAGQVPRVGAGPQGHRLEYAAAPDARPTL